MEPGGDKRKQNSHGVAGGENVNNEKVVGMGPRRYSGDKK